MDALVGRAAALRAVELVEPRSVLGKSTVECIQSGAVYGFAAQVDGLCERIQDELGECTIVSTGGLADLITPLSRDIEHVEPWLTLHGLRLVYEKNVECNVSVPYRFETTATTSRRSAAAATTTALEPGEETGIEVRSPVGSCCTGRRASSLFATLRDGSGTMQLFALAALTDDFDGFVGHRLGDWVGATGEVVKTKRGELSVKVASWVDARRDAPQLPGQVARHQRRRHALPPALRRPVGESTTRARPSCSAAGS